jgi:CDP-diacylglycerol--glycerol-3-phosphate 3-phosphatidyltransferase
MLDHRLANPHADAMTKRFFMFCSTLLSPNLPWANFFTVLRLALIPMIVGLLAIAAGWSGWLAWFLFLVAAASDWLDGYLARRLQQQSAFGICLDPIADKVLVLVVLITLLTLQQLPAIALIPVGLILTREVLVAGLREFLALRQLPMPVTYLAKIKTALQLLCLTLLLLPLPSAQVGGQWLLWISAAVTAYTGLQYAWQAKKHMGLAL